MHESNVNSQKFVLPPDLQRAFERESDDWRAQDKTARLWRRDASIWTSGDESKWLDWLSIVEQQLAEIENLKNFQAEVRERAFSHVLLMGMGGSSLAPEVLTMTYGKQDGFPEFHVLDSTVPAQVLAFEEKIDLAKTLFIVSSKSGSTLEPNCFKQYFYQRVAETIGREHAGAQFVAITDPGSKMQQVAERDRFWRIFYGLPEIGGRFSALSNFGMIPAAAMGLDLEKFLQSAARMVAACQQNEQNPGVELGLILGAANKIGRDKMTIFTSPKIFDVGAWLEQLVAESTGKRGVAIIPVDGESMLEPEIYGDDRIFVRLNLENDYDANEAALAALESAGQPVIKINLPHAYDLGQELFRWEIATAVAGSVMQINPFDQPDVESAKIEARKITEEYEKNGALPEETPFFVEANMKFFSDEQNQTELNRLTKEKSPKGVLQAHLARLKDGDYFAILAFIEMNAANYEMLAEIRHRILKNTGAATCLGFGPRFLHSTGQAYKGGANNGVFLQITADDAVDFFVPEQKITFGVVKTAQARGDFQVLVDRDRRALRVHLSNDIKTGLESLLSEINESLK